VLSPLAVVGALSVMLAGGAPTDTGAPAPRPQTVAVREAAVARADTAPFVALRLRATAAHAALLSPVRSSASGTGRLDLAPRPEASVGQSTVSDTSIAPPQLIEYSDAYFTRLTIHKWASWLTLPLFVAQYTVGQKLIDGNGSDGLRSVHGVLAGGVAGLFVVNTVTGGLNAIEAWHDPDGRNRRILHTVLMLVADAGFVATAATAQERENEGGVVRGGSNNTHRAVALASMGTALVGVAVMLPIFGRK
jgi:hypothetical protein